MRAYVLEIDRTFVSKSNVRASHIFIDGDIHFGT